MDHSTLIDPQSWAEARSNPASPLYFPDDINEYEDLISAAEAAGDDLFAQANDICKFVAGRFTHIFSAGSGPARLEYCIHLINRAVRLTLSEHCEAVVSRLQRVFQGVEQIDVRFLDLLRLSDFQLSKCSVLLLFRLDTDFSNSQWKNILSELHKRDVRDILFIPSAPLKIRRVLQLLFRIYPDVLVNRRGWIFTGYLRSRSAFDVLLQDSYRRRGVIPIGRQRFGWHLAAEP